ncbi:MAG: asparagine synthase C-terminal domain-containing protein, partial [Candidatus Riflebacteria bacterium]|nr:asparagine synthase C-terminal domain-containing protein [Candidatus Riflebacteria bacterium]
SSTVAALMARASGGPVKTFAVGFEGSTALDERRYALQVARHLGTDHHELVVQAPTCSQLLALTWHLDAPPSNPATLATMLLSELARRHVKVVLTGEGADELLGGYGKYVYPHVASMVPRPIARALAPLMARLPPGGLTGRLRKLGEVLALDDPDLRFAHVNTAFNDGERSEILCDGSLLSTPEIVSRVVGTAPGTILDRMMRFDLLGYLPEDNLMKVDRVTMAHGLEGRAPFLDHAFVTLALGIPASRKVRLFDTKLTLRQAATELLPAGIAGRPKHAFELPVDSWLRRPLAPFVDSVLCPAFLSRQRLFVPDAVARLVQEHRAGARALWRKVWTLVAFQIWYLKFIEDPALAGPMLSRLESIGSLGLPT